MSATEAQNPELQQAQALLDELLAAIKRSPGGEAALQSIDPHVVEADYGLAWQALAEDRMVEATDRFGALALRAPDQHRIQFGFALCLQHFGLINDALRHYGMAFVLDPSSAACALRMGECLAATGAIDDSREALLTAIELSAIEGSDPQIRIYAQQALDQLN